MSSPRRSDEPSATAAESSRPKTPGVDRRSPYRSHPYSGVNVRDLWRRPTLRRAGRCRLSGRPGTHDRRDAATAARTTSARTPLPGSRSVSGGSASSTLKTGISRSQTRTGRSGRPRTASSTTTRRSASGSISDGTCFTSRCDTEILPHLYEDSGTTSRLSCAGCSAIAIWDGRRRRAVLARDRLGIKPLYYATQRDLLVFASELKSLLA